jgi:hypothetical protein
MESDGEKPWRNQYTRQTGNCDFAEQLVKRGSDAPLPGKPRLSLLPLHREGRHPDDQPSIGIILCKTRDRFVAEYALRDINKPIGISEYRLAESLPEKLKGSLPTIEELESELGAASAKEPG